MERFVPIQLEVLIEAFNAPPVNSIRYLNTETGEIFKHRNLKGDTDGTGKKIEGKNPFHHKKFLEIPQNFYETYRDMEEFRDTVTDKYLKAALGVSLAKPDSFAEFNRALKDYPAENGRWFKFRRQQSSKCVYEWLRQHNLKIEDQGKK